MKKVQFVVDAKKYFEADADRLEKVKDGDICLVTIDFERKKAGYIWYNPDAVSEIDRDPGNFPAIEDDYEGVLQLWEELGRPQD